MDVDGDVDGKLAQELSCLGTVDRETLVREFQKILGPYKDVSSQSCAFFLDMNNWNLQAALGSFYDYAMSQENGSGQNFLVESLSCSEPPTMEFVRDVTIGEGESVPRDTKFDKTWRLRNPSPTNPWPIGCFLKHIEGPLLAPMDSVPVPSLGPGEEGDISVHMLSPSLTGIYQSRWQLNTMGGIPFGESIWSIIVVDEGGLLGITQQMASATCGYDQQQNRSQNTNIFGGHSTPFSGSSSRVPLAQSSSVSSSSVLTNSQSWGGVTGTSPTFSYGHQPITSFPRANVEISRLNASPVSADDSNIPGRLSVTPPEGEESMEGSHTPGSLQQLNSSVSAVRGSPAFLEYDAPASPNGSSALYAAVAAAVPHWTQERAMPIDIPASSAASHGFSRVPPCTPSSPSLIQNNCSLPPDPGNMQS